MAIKIKGKKVALVTGGNRGLGFELCKQLGALGYHVILGSRHRQRGKVAVKKLKSLKIATTFVQLNLSNRKSMLACHKFIAKNFSQLNVLVNNGAIANDNQMTIDKISYSKFKSALVTNSVGPIYLTQLLADLFPKGGGQIINISSGMAVLKNLDPEEPGYRLSKLMLDASTLMFSQSYLRRKIAVNTVYPGVLQTRIGSMQHGRPLSMGADTVIWLIKNKKFVTGKIFKDRQEISIF